jgi:hypothetical protein
MSPAALRQSAALCRGRMQYHTFAVAECHLTNFDEYVLQTSISLGVRWRLRTFAARVRIARSSSSGSAASVAIVAFGVSQIGFSVGGCDEWSKLWLPGEFI